MLFSKLLHYSGLLVVIACNVVYCAVAAPSGGGGGGGGVKQVGPAESYITKIQKKIDEIKIQGEVLEVFSSKQSTEDLVVLENGNVESKKSKKTYSSKKDLYLDRMMTLFDLYCLTSTINNKETGAFVNKITADFQGADRILQLLKDIRTSYTDTKRDSEKTDRLTIDSLNTKINNWADLHHAQGKTNDPMTHLPSPDPLINYIKRAYQHNNRHVATTDITVSISDALNQTDPQKKITKFLIAFSDLISWVEGKPPSMFIFDFLTTSTVQNSILRILIKSAELALVGQELELAQQKRHAEQAHSSAAATKAEDLEMILIQKMNEETRKINTRNKERSVLRRARNAAYHLNSTKDEQVISCLAESHSQTTEVFSRLLFSTTKSGADLIEQFILQDIDRYIRVEERENSTEEIAAARVRNQRALDNKKYEDESSWVVTNALGKMAYHGFDAATGWILSGKS